MTDISHRWASVTARIKHGTATPISIPSVIPEGKQEKEVFWANALVTRLTELQALNPSVAPCPDDSHGNHDVIVTLSNGESIGIQVTELTYQLERARHDQANRFVAKALECFAKRGLSSARKLLVHCFVPFASGNRYVAPKVELLAGATDEFIRGTHESQVVIVEKTKVHFDWVDNGEIYVPSSAGIGVVCDLDALPRTLEMFCDAIDCLRDNKANSNSPWLLVWSKSFHRDKHWLGGETLAHMRKAFSSASFKRVYFVESMDGLGFFEANLVIHAIKA